MLATDEWLRVNGCDNVYALGDCATITQRKVMVCACYSVSKYYFASLTVYIMLFDMVSFRYQILGMSHLLLEFDVTPACSLL